MMPNFPTCAGCFISPAWSYPPPPPLAPPGAMPAPSFIPIPDYSNGLTADEQAVLRHLADAFNAFVALVGKHPDDDAEFRKEIEDAQKCLALRVARRVDPHIWTQPQEEAHGSAEPQCVLGEHLRGSEGNPTGV